MDRMSKDIKDINVRRGWLKFMYIFAIVVAGGFGLGVIFCPNVITSIYRIPKQDPIIFGIVGGVYVAFGILSIFGSSVSSQICAYSIVTTLL